MDWACQRRQLFLRRPKLIVLGRVSNPAKLPSLVRGFSFPRQAEASLAASIAFKRAELPEVVRRAAAKYLTHEEARRIAVNIRQAKRALAPRLLDTRIVVHDFTP
jgi:hypothetical protein